MVARSVAQSHSVFLAVLAIAGTGFQQPPAGTLILANSRWDQVRVEVRIGPSTNCAANAVVGTRTIKRGQGWTIVSRNVVCWRREQVPGNAAKGWTGWLHARVPNATVQKASL